MRIDGYSENWVFPVKLGTCLPTGQKTGFEEEGKDPFHGKRLADHSAGGLGKLGPIGAELELHGVPVTTRIAKLIPKILPQNRVERL